MIVRPAKSEDVNALIELHKGHTFPFPKFDNTLDILVVEKDGKVVAWGYTKKYVEIVFVPDKNSPKPTIVKSLKLLVDKSTELTKARGIDQVHSYVQDENFVKLLVERFNYGVCTGTPLFLNLDTNG
jgi:hypothetical protein